MLYPCYDHDMSGGHDHAHPHTHDHDHVHEHDHACDGHIHCGEEHNCAECGHAHAAPREDLIALMKYMVGHNTSHANELAQLAKQLDEVGEHTAYEQVMQAVSDFEKGNMRLSTVLAALNA